ncbi:MAG TPA: MbtH family protein [Pseudonocardiaceae bacterium]|nr:MbtH family protein [Pseudonocardiaceae bacterium]
MSHPIDDERTYLVVVNHEEQYSIWLAAKKIPNGWRSEGTNGTKQACLDHIDRVWTDMRPLSLRANGADAGGHRR